MSEYRQLFSGDFECVYRGYSVSVITESREKKYKEMNVKVMSSVATSTLHTWIFLYKNV